MKNLKKILGLVLVVTLFATALVGCNKGGDTQTDKPTDQNVETSDKGDKGSSESIYFLNFKPEIAEIYEKIAKDYEAETGVKVKVVTAASGTYETTLKSEIAKSEAPTIFQVNGPVGYDAWKEFTLDLKDTDLYSYLIDKDLAIKDGDGVFGIPYVVEGYGIIYNNAIMEKYFSLDNKAVSYSSMDEINTFDKLKEVVEDMTANKDKLEIEGVFASTSLGAGEQWRWQTHLANLPLYYEFGEDNDFQNTVMAGLESDEIEFKYADNFKNIFDLYINNSVTPGAMLGAKSVGDSMAEFALGKAAMVQNGNWAWSQIGEVDGNVVDYDDIKFLPIYTGMPNDEKQGLCIGTENYFAINNKVSKEKQDASVAFLEWLFTSDIGKAYVTNDLGFIAPFNTFEDNEKPDDPLAKEILAWMEKDVTSVDWTFAAFPSEDFKDYFGNALLEYAQGNETWENVVEIVKEAWKEEKAK